MTLQELRKKCLNYETVSYFIAGVLTTVVDYVVFILVNEKLKALSMGTASAAMAATVVSWIAAVLFAYVTNKLIVFRSFNFRPRYLLKEVTGFFAARGLSGVITLLLMWLMVDILTWNAYLAKIITSVFNMVFNYVASKLFIFRNN